MKFRFTYALTIALGLSACTSQESLKTGTSLEVQPQREALVRESVKFKTFTRKEVRALSQSGDGIGLRFTIARKKYDCDRGFGLCLVTHASMEARSIDQYDALEQENIAQYVPLQGLKEGLPYFNLLLSSYPEGTFTDEELTLRIDEDIILPSNGHDTLGRSYKIRAGEYKLNRHLDEFGGYTIRLSPCIE